MVFEILIGNELGRFNVVEESPQFFSVVLYRSASEKQYTVARHFLKSGKYFGIRVFKTVGFINNNILERDINEDRMYILKEDFITSDKNMEFIDSVSMYDSPLGTNVCMEPFICSTSGSTLSTLYIIV